MIQRGGFFVLITDLQEMGNRLMAYRKKCGLTQAQMAEAADLSLRAYSKIEHGQSEMRIITALQICSALDITPNDLFCEEEATSSETITSLLETCSGKDRKMISGLIRTYLDLSK